MAVDHENALESMVREAAAGIFDIADKGILGHGQGAVKIHGTPAVALGYRRGKYGNLGCEQWLSRRCHCTVRHRCRRKLRGMEAATGNWALAIRNLAIVQSALSIAFCADRSQVSL